MGMRPIRAKGALQKRQLPGNALARRLSTAVANKEAKEDRQPDPKVLSRRITSSPRLLKTASSGPVRLRRPHTRKYTPAGSSGKALVTRSAQH
jgi:hypothetical protein